MTKTFEKRSASQLCLVQQHLDVTDYSTSGKESVKDKERRGRPTTTKTFENITRVEQILKKDRRISCRMIAEEYRDTEHNFSTHFMG